MSPDLYVRWPPRWLAFALALWCTCHGACTHADACSPESVGVDTSHGDTYFPIFMGGARGQVFEALDTVLEAVSVWRDTLANITPLRLYGMELDSTGTPVDNRVSRKWP